MENLERKLKILKAVLLLRRTNRHQSKEEQIAEAEKYYSDETLDKWIEDLKAPDEDMPAFEESLEYTEKEQRYTSATEGDYGPGCPWNAPGMSISDFI